MCAATLRAMPRLHRWISLTARSSRCLHHPSHCPHHRYARSERRPEHRRQAVKVVTVKDEIIIGLADGELGDGCIDKRVRSEDEGRIGQCGAQGRRRLAATGSAGQDRFALATIIAHRALRHAADDRLAQIARRTRRQFAGRRARDALVRRHEPPPRTHARASKTCEGEALLEGKGA